MRVLLGPSHELHGGIHGALTENGPPEVEYVARSYTLFFQQHSRASARPPKREGPPFSPVRDYSECEWVRFEDEQDIELIHSARFPVETSLPWVVDADCLLLPLQIGAFFALGLVHGGALPDARSIQRREVLMLNRYADPRCRRILLRTARAKRHFLERLAEHDEIGPETASDIASKTEVVVPALTCTPRPTPASSRPTILFMGRTFEDKGGPLALLVFQRLRELFGQGFDATLVTSCTAEVAGRCAAMNIDVQPTSDRPRYLEQLARANIFFSPTSFESFGMGLIEAAAARVAIVTSSGPGMEHIDELFEDGKDALFVSNALDEDSRVRAYVAALAKLITDTTARQSLAANAGALTSHGRLSLSRHNQTMLRIYEEARRSASAGRASPASRAATKSARILGWSEQTCHWMRQRLTPEGGVRICV